MTSLKEIFCMAFPKKHATNSNDVENSRMSHNSMAGVGPPVRPQPVQYDSYGRPNIDPSDNLNLFRHLTGIISDPSMLNSNGLFSSGGRAAPNLGIYSRVVRNENHAKVGFKYFSWLINGCLGVQIVVAAALTALGASGGSRGAVTIFGAINTVIAGILTFLKGSGLPNRFKYYQTEWKRVREFIEQRERDFSRPNCDLEVYAVVAIVESMYEDVKLDLEASQPDRFAGHSSVRKSTAQLDAAPSYNLSSVALPRMTQMTEKGKEVEASLGSKVKNIASEIGHYAQQAREVVKDLQSQKEEITQDANKRVSDYTTKAVDFQVEAGNKLRGLVAGIGEKAHMAEEAAHDAEQHEHRAITGAIKEARDHLEQLEAVAKARLSSPVTIQVAQPATTNTSTIGGKKLAEDY